MKHSFIKEGDTIYATLGKTKGIQKYVRYIDGDVDITDQMATMLHAKNYSPISHSFYFDQNEALSKVIHELSVLLFKNSHKLRFGGFIEENKE